MCSERGGGGCLIRGALARYAESTHRSIVRYEVDAASSWERWKAAGR